MKKAELIIIPSPGMGHLMAAVEMAKRLICHNPGRLFVIVIVMKLPFDSKATSYAETLFSSISDHINLLLLPPRNTTYSHPNPLIFTTSFIHDQKPLVTDAVSNLIASKTGPDSPRIAGFLVDMFCTAMIDVADHFGLPTYIFYTSGAGFLGFMFHVLDLHDKEDVDATQLVGSESHNIPSFVNPVPTSVFPGVVLDTGCASTMLMHTRKAKNTKGIIINSFTELESHAIKSLSDHPEFPPLYPVGPVLNLSLRDNKSSTSSDKITTWLDQQPPSSVLFLCFGSMGSFSEAQITEIAAALEQTQVRFLWSLRRPPAKDNMVFLSSDYEDPEEVLPEGFVDRTAGIGKIIGWAPQVDVLGHEAVGGFVSHCGWNSILESIWFGVPVATWPLHAEQQLNAFQLVKDLGIAVEIRLDTRNAFYRADDIRSVVKAEEVKAGIEKVMDGDCVVRKRVKVMSEKSKRAIMEGGSSYSSLQNFMDALMDSLA